ncbi:Rpn family recombination-promoting nuclease/putative transposase [Bacteroides sp.]
MATSNYIRFDWAMKRLLRNKANFVVLEGFLSTLLGEKIRIERILESEGNKEDETDKFNRVDLLAEDDKGELIIIEVQNNRELDYFHRMLYGTSKAITEYIHEGDNYDHIRKVYSINIVYFDLGQGTDYVYRGATTFHGIHTHDELQLTVAQRKQFMVQTSGELFPEYYVLRVDDFDKVATNPLDEWISFLKTGEIPDSATADGLPQARELLRKDRMSREELEAYKRHMEALRYQRSVIKTGLIEGREEGIKEGREEGIKEGREEGMKEGIKKGREEGKKEERISIARQLKSISLSTEKIVQITGLSAEEVGEL